MSRDQRFPGWKYFRTINTRLHTPLNATLCVALVGQAILAAFSGDTDALFTLFSAATLLPAMIYAVCVSMYAIKRHRLPATQSFSLGVFELPVLALAMLWLVFELAIFRDASFAKSWLYVGLMLGIGTLYLAGLLYRGGRAALRMPDLIAIDTIMDADKGEQHG